MMLNTIHSDGGVGPMPKKKGPAPIRPRPHGRRKNTIDAVSRKLASLLEAKHWSQQHLADVTGLTQSTVSRIISKGQRANADELARIANALGIPLIYLVDPSRPDEPDLARLGRELSFYEDVKAIGLDEARRRIMGIMNPIVAPVRPITVTDLNAAEAAPPAVGGVAVTREAQKEAAAKKPRLHGGGGKKG